MSNKLREVTYKTVKDLKNNDIILPGEYSKKFEKFAKELEVDIDNQNVILKDLHENCEKMNKIVETTNDSLESIHSCTQKAKTAIENRDEKALNSTSEELKAMQKQIEFLQKELFSDTLTKAYNRKWFVDFYLENEKFETSGHFVFVDLNKFKIINDTYGHLIGDQVLKYLVRFLQTELAYENVKVIRYAGDEFIVIFEESDKKQDINSIMKNTRDKLARQKLKSAKVNNLQFSFSYGVVKFEKNDNLEAILEKADKLMYKNKELSS